MDANIVDLEGLFSGQVSFRIPQFQRPYAWKKDTQWEPLWQDVRSVAERFLARQSDDHVRPHFMGAIVLQQQTSNVGEVTKRLVVDGQQRLTTLQLLVRAAQHAFQSRDDTVRANRLLELTANKDSHWAGDSDNETKIRQSNVSDQKAFQDVIRLDAENDGSSLWLIREAYDYFKTTVSAWLDSDVEQRDIRADALEKTLKELLQIAAIDLDADEKPHIIFETLNARAEVLLQSDLIKNTVMYEAEVVDDASRARELWGMFEDEWWRRDSGEGRVGRIHLDRFLNYWMVMRTRQDVQVGRVASSFRNYVAEVSSESPDYSIDVIAKDIRHAGSVYRDMEENRVPGIEIFLRRMKVMELGVIMPLLLWLFTSEVSSDRRCRSVEALESYLIRRMLCGIQSQGFNRFFVSLLERLSKENPDSADETIIDYLRSQTVENRIWPSDRMVSDNLTDGSMKGTAARRTMVLEAIEASLSGELAEPLGSTSKLTLEHIMPRKWESNWPLPEMDPSDRFEAEEQRRRAVGALGNLTLTTGKLNSRLSNGPWAEKRTALGKHSRLLLNRVLPQNDDWNEDAIAERSTTLAERVLAIWPSGDDFAGVQQ